MSSLVSKPTLGLEQIQRAALYIFYKEFNNTLAHVEAAWADSDEAFATAMGRDPVVVDLPAIPDDHFHEGHRPSLINAPVENYPALSVMVLSGRRIETASDHTETYVNNLIVEMFVCTEGEGETAETVIERRAHRYAEAAEVLMSANPTLANTVLDRVAGPKVDITNTFIRKDKTSYGKPYSWKGIRMEYNVRKDAVLPSSAGGNLVGGKDIDDLVIDQVS